MSRGWTHVAGRDVGVLDSLSEILAREVRFQVTDLPDLRAAKTLVLLSDYAGSHASATHEVYSFCWFRQTPWRLGILDARERVQPCLDTSVGCPTQSLGIRDAATQCPSFWLRPIAYVASSLHSLCRRILGRSFCDRARLKVNWQILSLAGSRLFTNGWKGFSSSPASYWRAFPRQARISCGFQTKTRSFQTTKDSVTESTSLLIIQVTSSATILGIFA